MQDVIQVEQIEHVKMEIRIGRRLAPVGEDGRCGEVSAVGEVDAELASWLKLLKQRVTIADDADGTFVWVYIAGQAGTWTLAWEAGVPVAAPATATASATALEDAAVGGRRRLDVELAELAVQRAQHQKALLEDAITRMRQEEAALASSLAAERTRVAAEKTALVDELIAYRKDLRAQREAAREEHKMQMDAALAQQTRLQENAQKLSADLIEYQNSVSTNTAAQVLNTSNQVTETLDAFETLVKNKLVATTRTPQPTGGDMLMTALAKNVEQGLVRDVGKGIMDAIKLFKTATTKD